MAIGFTGTQLGLVWKQKSTLKSVLEKLRPVFSKFHHGDCIGADKQANDLARELNYRIVSHPPSNEKKRAFCEADQVLPPKEYLARNHDIVNCSQVLIACPKESQEVVRSGTWSTIRYARKMKKDIIIIYFDGTIRKEIRSK